METISSLTKGGYRKYYSICRNPECRMFRVQNHCSSPACSKAIIKHAFGNYHVRQSDGVQNSRNHWAYICPECGNEFREEPGAASPEDTSPATEEALRLRELQDNSAID